MRTFYGNLHLGIEKVSFPNDEPLFLFYFRKRVLFRWDRRARKGYWMMVLCQKCHSQKYDSCECPAEFATRSNVMKIVHKETFQHIAWIKETWLLGWQGFGLRIVKHFDNNISILLYLFNKTYVLWGWDANTIIVLAIIPMSLWSPSNSLQAGNTMPRRAATKNNQRRQILFLLLPWIQSYCFT